LLPHAYIDELSRLQDTIPPLPFEQMVTVLVEELGDTPENLFAELDPQPVASASIGQVYNAVLHSGQKVVIKIVRPQALETFERDLEILTDIAEWASQHTTLGQMYDLHALVDEFAYTVRTCVKDTTPMYFAGIFTATCGCTFPGFTGSGRLAG
jgi:ubiquinone biosynthesis protein